MRHHSNDNYKGEPFLTTFFKIARTFLYVRSLCFWIAFLGSNELTDFYDFGILNKEWSNFKKRLFIFLKV